MSTELLIMVAINLVAVGIQYGMISQRLKNLEDGRNEHFEDLNRRISLIELARIEDLKLMTNFGISIAKIESDLAWMKTWVQANKRIKDE